MKENVDLLGNDETIEVKNEVLEQYDVEENNDVPNVLEEIDENEVKIFSKAHDPGIDSLLSKYERGTLSLVPLGQRRLVWKQHDKSLLMLSALQGVPLPQLYLSEEQDGSEGVIDGKQRLNAFFDFITNKFPLKFTKESIGTSDPKYVIKSGRGTRGRYFKELTTAQQDKIMYYPIRTITLLKECDPELKFLVFERLNGTGTELNAQELRNSVFRGKYNDLLTELAASDDFLNLIRETDGRLSRMFDVEYVLRFAAFFQSRYTQNSLKKFLNQHMKTYQHSITDEQIRSLKLAFKTGLSNCKTLFGENAFRNFIKGKDGINGGWNKSFSVVLYELCMVTLARYDKSLVMRHLEEIRESWIDLITSEEFLHIQSQGHTSDAGNVYRRFTMWETRLHSIMGNDKKEPRCFSNELKKSLFIVNSTCSICGQQIMSIDDAAVDHIEQYWLGGKTIPSNARLSHRFCNNSRSKFN